jgi:hypothetical protein
LIDIVGEFLTPFFRIMLNTDSGEFFFAKCLLLILLFIVIYFILEKSDILGDKKGVIFIIALAVSILGMRYLPESDFIKFILLPYGTLGVALLTFIPFMIYFFFVYQSLPSHGSRLLAWIVYAVVFAALTLFRVWEAETTIIEGIYIAGLVLVILCMLFDNTLKTWLDHRALFRAISELNATELATDWQSYKQLRDYYRDSGDKRVLKKLKRLEKRFKNTPSEGNLSAGAGI